MADTSNYDLYRKQLKKCELFYNKTAVALLGVIVMGVMGSVVELLIEILKGGQVTFLFFKYAVCVLGCSAASYYAMYRNRTAYIYLSTALSAVGMIFNISVGSGFLNMIVVLVDIVLCLMLPPVNKKMEFLKQQEGYPHFSPLLSEQLEKSENAAITGRYDENPLYYKSDSSGSMDEITVQSSDIEPKADEKNSLMDEI